MENEIKAQIPQPPSSKNIITDPQKLTNQIKRSGNIGIIYGALLILIGLLIMVVNKSAGSMLIYGIVGIVYIILGFKIRNNPTVSKEVLQFTFWFSIALAFIGFAAGGQGPSLLLLVYIWMLSDSIKFVKRLEAIKNSAIPV